MPASSQVPPTDSLVSENSYIIKLGIVVSVCITIIIVVLILVLVFCSALILKRKWKSKETRTSTDASTDLKFNPVYYGFDQSVHTTYSVVYDEIYDKVDTVSTLTTPTTPVPFPSVSPNPSYKMVDIISPGSSYSLQL